MDPSIVQSIWQASKIAFVLTDQDLVIQELYGSPQILDIEERNCQGCSLLQVFPELLGSQGELEEILAGKLSSLKLEYLNRETDQGQTRYLTLESLPYRDEAGEISGIVHLVQDVTKRGELEQQLTQHRNQLQLLKEQLEHKNRDLVAANRELQRLGEIKSQFISVAAHELRTPLTSLNGYVEMLIDGQIGSLSDKQRRVLEIIQKSALRLSRLTDNLLNAARLEAGQIDMVLQPVDLAELVREVLSECAVQIQSKEQRLHLEVSPELPTALCDPNWTRHIVANLLSNAGKFTPEGGAIRVTLSLAEQAGYLQLSVADTGIGIPEQDQARVFSRWFRAANASSIKTEGSGLGLYITRALVALHNGSIWVESQPGQGSVFHVTFPIAA